MNSSPATLALVPLGVVTWILCSPAACAGESAVMLVAVGVRRLAPATVPKSTEVTPRKLAPVMVTNGVPPVVGPEAGEILVTEGTPR